MAIEAVGHRARYDQICKDTKFFSDLFATDPARIPDPKAKAFYRDYQDRLIAGEKGKEPEELKKEYRAERRKDYQDYVRKGNLSHCFKENSNGTYSMVAGWESRISVIDSYDKLFIPKLRKELTGLAEK